MISYERTKHLSPEALPLTHHFGWLCVICCRKPKTPIPAFIATGRTKTSGKALAFKTLEGGLLILPP